jgi:enoyl-CoA hydratase/carnithine racemase
LADLLPQGLELDESDTNPAANSSGFFPLLATITDFPFPTIALITGHTFGKNPAILIKELLDNVGQ